MVGGPDVVEAVVRLPTGDLVKAFRDHLNAAYRRNAHRRSRKGTTSGAWSEDAIESRTCTQDVSTSK